jgi:hypothetical protein
VFSAIRRFSEDVDLSIGMECLGRNEAFLEEAPSKSTLRRRIAEIEQLCAEKTKNEIKAMLERAIREKLGARADSSNWSSYVFDPATSSPTLFFSYPVAIAESSRYIPQSVKIDLGRSPTSVRLVRT